MTDLTKPAIDRMSNTLSQMYIKCSEENMKTEEGKAQCRLAKRDLIDFTAKVYEYNSNLDKSSDDFYGYFNVPALGTLRIWITPTD